MNFPIRFPPLGAVEAEREERLGFRNWEKCEKWEEMVNYRLHGNTKMLIVLLK